jgi:glycosyltransferase involved in cell wall biosynthesis
MKTLKIALLGTRGVPSSYSGFETCVEQLGQRLVERGHDVTVYARKHHIKYDGAAYKGMKLVKLGTVQNKYLDTIVHSFLSSLHALVHRYDIALYFIAGNSPVSWIPRIVGTKTILNVDGLDWEREKWPMLAKKYIQFSEFLATKLPNMYLTDCAVVQDYYQTNYKNKPPYIPYGSEVTILPPGDTLKRFNLEPNKYVLFVGRLVPENCVHHLIAAFRNIETDLKCVIVGSSSYSDDYIQELHALAKDDPRIIFTGYAFGKDYYELGSNSLIFVETSGVGGTHPALTEAMGFGNCIIVNDTPQNLETIADSGMSYQGKIGAESLQQILQEALVDQELIIEYKNRAYLRAKIYYSWDSVADAYELLFYKLQNMDIPERLQDQNMDVMPGIIDFM